MAKLVLVVLLVAVVSALAVPADRYSDKFDNVDVDGILKNDRLVDNYVKCLLGPTDAGCTADGKLLKGVLAEALQTDCAKCTEKQKEIIEKVIPFLKDNRKDAWTKLAAKYDPEGQYASRHALAA